MFFQGLRTASLLDAPLLLAWRNDDSTRLASHNTAPISLDEHLLWLKSSTSDEQRKLFIYEELGVACGTVRADLCPDGSWELSWMIASEKRGCGIAKKMVSLLINQNALHFRAEIKKWNIASSKIAKFVGMQLEKEIDGVLYYSNKPSDKATLS